MSKYGSPIIYQSTTRPSSSYTSGSSESSSSSTYSSDYYGAAPSTSGSTSMDYSYSYSSPSSGASGYSGKYRSGSASGYTIDVKETKNNVVIVQHNRPSADKDEPRSSDYRSSKTSRSKKHRN
ncbi:hypothetical protein B0T22DRAFT_441353 [Podospora appendiculata]|uniref:Uncharacterized protein n=1 Tax=Podospora appendiculata TaxID=314037 RepID=A0AAE1CDN1_9PEZI|nr:hypothetical protein B0T22DRAFT_441353 [Podospora appendiculata]